MTNKQEKMLERIHCAVEGTMLPSVLDRILTWEVEPVPTTDEISVHIEVGRDKAHSKRTLLFITKRGALCTVDKKGNDYRIASPCLVREAFRIYEERLGCLAECFATS